MKTIGIKLADGSFYPVLEDNKASKKQLELTTAHNNQTKVMVDLYRSATCSMEDAEYVDSLQIENLVAHPNGEAEIKFNISLDEDNQLSASIVDSETGNESDTTITLVSRTLEERLVTDEYDINDTKDEEDTAAALAGAAAAGGLLATAAALRDTEEEAPVEETAEAPAEEPEVEVNEEAAAEEPVFDETMVEEPAEEEVAEESVEETTPEIAAEEPVEEAASEEVIFDEAPLEASASEEITETNETTDSSDLNDDFSDLDLDLPDDFASEESTEASESTEEINASDDIFNIDETINEEDNSLPDMDFDLPEENASDEITSDETISSEDTIEEDSDLPDMDFDLPDDTSSEETTEDPEMPEDFFNIDTEETMKDPTFDSESPAAAGLNFDGLYDEETTRGTPAQDDEDEVKKKTKVPVIICIICAIICIIATVLILFIIPSKYNLITKKNAKEAANTVAIEEPAPEPEAPAQPEPEPEPAVPEAKEDEVIIIEKAEEVVPAQPPVAEEKPKDITYKIKWGDTLWDIADTYYKNPWRYKYIARYNGIKNPDYIISGTKIVIPAE